VVSDAVEGLGAEVEWSQGDISTPDRMVEPALDIRGERILGGVAPGPVTTVVSECDRFSERHVQPERPTDRSGDLGDLERMGQSSALVIVGKHEDLGFAGESPK